jgi:hypothetical protein
LPESPKFLEEKKEYLSATYSYNRIIAFNGGRNDDDFISASYLENEKGEMDSSFGLDSDINDYKTPRKRKESEVANSLRKLWKDKTYRASLIFLLVSWAASQFCF